MDWFKVDARIATNPKIHELSHVAYRVLTYLWGHAMTHETGGTIPESVPSLIPYVTRKSIAELEARGFLHANGGGWVLHDWDDHQEEALRVQEKKRADAARKREERHAKNTPASKDTSKDTSRDAAR